MQFDVESVISYDTETTGLRPYLGDLPFGFAFSNSQSDLYLDEKTHSKEEIYEHAKAALSGDHTVVMHNAKFDMHHTQQWCNAYKFPEIDFSARIICTATMARLVNNDRFETSLEVMAKEYGLEKSDAVEKWITKNKAFKIVDGENVKDFRRVPLEIISEYAKKDSRITYQLYFLMLQDLIRLQATITDHRSIFDVLERESETTKALYHVERVGVLIDPVKIKQAYDITKARAESAKAKYQEVAGVPFVDSGASHAKALIASGYDESKIIKTEKGNYSFKSNVMHNYKGEIADSIVEFRDSSKKADTTYIGLLRAKDPFDRIHTEFRQDSTRTSRLSSTNPNLQNIPKERVPGQIYERDCFIVDPGHTWVSIDYKAQEMRLLFDMSGETSVAKRIIEGEDVHIVTSELMGVSRKKAKDVGFALVYGKGTKQLAIDLGVSYNEAAELRRLFFDRMPKSARFIKEVLRKAEGGFITNPYGRVFRFTKDNSYKAVNYLIQGTASEIGKDALIGVIKSYKQSGVKVVSLIHDELNYVVENDKIDEVKNLCNIMTGVYKHKTLPMDVSVTMSEKSWGECE